MSLPSGEQITVLTVKSQRYVDGDLLHLFYQTDRDNHDTVAMRARARAIWPAFAPFVVAGGYTIGAISAEHVLIDIGNQRLGLHRVARWGIVARQDKTGTWRLDGDPMPLPPPVIDAKPIVDRNGVPLQPAPRRALH